jgi:hypothetical protein
MQEDSSPFHEDDVARLESLLAVRARERQDLAAELSRRTGLLRDAMARFADLPASAPEVAPRVADSNVEAMVHFAAQRDAAVARALEAEAARAEALFRLDEALGHLRMAQQSAGQDAELQGKVRGLRVRLAESEEAREIAEARLMLAEQDLDDAGMKVTEQKRKAQELTEQLELMIVQAHSADGAHASKLADLRTALSVARGHAQGLRARADESEQALSGVRARALRAEHAAREALDKLVVARAEAAERQVEGQAATQRARELQQELATAEQSGRQLQNEVQRVREALNALQGEHRQRLQELHGTLKATREAALELGASVIDVVSGARTPATAPEAEVSEELTVPGTSLGFEAVEALEKKLQVSEARVQELEAALAGRASREVGVSTLKGELIDVRASAARVADDLAKERARRRKIGVTVRALQAASESGEDVAPWVEEVLAILAEGATIPPPR